MSAPPKDDLERVLRSVQLGDRDALARLLSMAVRSARLPWVVEALGESFTHDASATSLTSLVATLEHTPHPHLDITLGSTPLAWEPRDAAAWACDCAERVHTLFTFEHPEDPTALAVLRASRARLDEACAGSQLAQTMKHFHESTRTRRHDPCTRAAIDAIMAASRAALRSSQPTLTGHNGAHHQAGLCAAAARRASSLYASEENLDTWPHQEHLWQAQRLLLRLTRQPTPDISRHPTPDARRSPHIRMIRRRFEKEGGG